jgi:hypothetical protein
MLIPFLAKTDRVKGTFLLSSITRRYYMSVYAVITFLAVTFLQKIATNRNFVLVENVEVIAVVAFFALTFKPMNADDLFVL